MSCNQSFAAQNWLFSVMICTSALLFFLRVRAIFFASRAASVYFFLLWLAVLGSCARVSSVMHASTESNSVSTKFNAPHKDLSSQRGTLHFCELRQMEVACLSCNISALVFDTIVFIALSWRILHFCAEDDAWSIRWRYFIGKLRLPYISESVLRGSQIYYMYVLLISAYCSSFVFTS